MARNGAVVHALTGQAGRLERGQRPPEANAKPAHATSRVGPEAMAPPEVHRGAAVLAGLWTLG